MKLADVRDLLSCEVLTGGDRLDSEADTAIASEAMSAVLAHPHPHAVLITQLATVQSVRTAVVAFVSAIVYVRGARPSETTVQIAREKGIVLLSTRLGMFECCGILHSEGIKGAS